jgi:hypothetical protein
LPDWLRQAFSRPGQAIDDVHFDQLSGTWRDVRDGLQWVSKGCEVLREVKRAIPTHANLAGVTTALVALPLDGTPRVRLWKPSHWHSAGLQTEPPSLILLKNENFEKRYDEEYSRRVNLPISSFPDVSAVFRSYRGLDEVDFGNVIFLVAILS